tara:strand:+ start:336 stop:545 length:210 start_codon:yes stop_codon:yes gene_type:complete
MFDFNAILAATCIETARAVARAQFVAAQAAIDSLDMDGQGFVSDAIDSELGSEWLADYRRLCGILGTLG